MYKDLYYIFNDENTHDRLIDIDTLHKIYDLLSDQYGLSKDININVVSDLSSNSVGGCNNRTGDIKVNIDNIKRLSTNKDTYFLNIGILSSFLHEVMHLRQFKFLKNNSIDDIDNPLSKLNYLLNLLSCSYFSYSYIEGNFGSPYDENVINKVMNFYSSNHDLIPQERLAEISSLKMIRWMLSKYDNNEGRREEAVDYLDKNIYMMYLYGYKYIDNIFLMCPIEYFLELFNYHNFYKSYISFYKELKNSNNMSDSISLTYGLPISDELYSKTKSTYNYLLNKEKEKSR